MPDCPCGYTYGSLLAVSSPPPQQIRLCTVTACIFWCISSPSGGVSRWRAGCLPNCSLSCAQAVLHIPRVVPAHRMSCIPVGHALSLICNLRPRSQHMAQPGTTQTHGIMARGSARNDAMGVAVGACNDAMMRRHDTGSQTFCNICPLI